MKELWDNALLGYNLPLTGLLILVVIYWLVSLFGLVDLEAFDLDIDGDVDGEADGQQMDGVLMAFLRFVNAQDVPLMIVMSLLILLMWIVSILLNAAFNPGHSAGLAMGLLLGNFVVSALLVKAITQPLRKFFVTLKNDKEHQEPLIGLSGVVRSRVLDHHFGQIEVPRTKGSPALLNAVLAEGSEPVMHGSEILVVSFDKEKDKYVVRSFTSSKE